jgi:hypothetical protein
MKLIITPYLESIELGKYLKEQGVAPVSFEEASQFATENPDENFTAPYCPHPSEKGFVAYNQKELVVGGGTFYFEGTKFLVKEQ